METFSTPIQEYFRNSTVLVVGATGLLGSLLVEKLLRTCTDLKKIYVLIRIKKGISSKERFKNFFDMPIFEKLKVQNPQFLNKVMMVSGDCSHPNLGLSEDDIKILSNEVNCIFYCAADISFEEKFRISVATNVTAVQDLFKIANLMPNLKSIVYVSTVFFNGQKHRDVIYEKVDDSNNNLPEQLQSLCNNFDDELLEKFKPIMSDTNIYCTTKWAAEILIKKIGKELPVVIIRPSMITPTLSDPIPGWINNFHGPIGILLAMSLGIFRVVLFQFCYKMDIIPADYVTNCMIASAWEIFRQNNNEVLENGTLKPSTVKIYNCTSSAQNPITYGRAKNLFEHYYKSMPFSMQVFYNKVISTSNIQLYYILNFIFCIVPLYIIQFVSYCICKPTKGIAKIKTQIHHYEKYFPFVLSDWNIRDDNVQILWQNLKDEDKVLFNFNVTDIDWNLYFQFFVKGVRIYLLKDPMETVPKAIKRRLKLKIIFYLITTLVFSGFVSILYLLIVKFSI